MLEAALWGSAGGSALVAGAAIGLEGGGSATGLVTVLGFTAAFLLTMVA